MRFLAFLVPFCVLLTSSLSPANQDRTASAQEKPAPKESARKKKLQEPERPYPYLDEEVSYVNKPAGVTLAGTFTKPKQGGPFAAVLLITGSGKQDRDE